MGGELMTRTADENQADLDSDIAELFCDNERLHTALQKVQVGSRKLTADELGTFCKQTKLTGEALWNDFEKARKRQRIASNYDFADYVRSIVV